ncbi:AAA family ATPase [Fusarium pseudocircinatum]|uniref:AAA family ATPase n=1 Tax=Fusarium pseudocircinatum TaxID=56676 RepID=A0A8H5KXB3_9HYPO|nr:AAA family ATPase [Fusarium pseudocircinatum]
MPPQSSILHFDVDVLPVPYKDALAEATNSIKIAPETVDKAPQRLIGLGSWTPSVQLQDNQHTGETFEWTSSWIHANARLAADASEKTTDDEESGDEEFGLKDTADKDKEFEDSDYSDNNSDNDSDYIGDSGAREDHIKTATELGSLRDRSCSGNSESKSDCDFGKTLYEHATGIPGDRDKDEEGDWDRDNSKIAEGSSHSEDSFGSESSWPLVRHITISRDQTHASSFNKELLAALDQGEDHWAPDLLIDQVTKGKRVEGHFGTTSFHFSPQDYRMQLMLLEQNSKRRSKMARQEQGIVPGPSTSAAVAPAKLVTAALEVEHEARKDKEPANAEAPVNFAQIAQLEQEIQKLRKLQNTLKSTTWLVLYKIEGEETTYLAGPSWILKKEQPLLFRGNEPLADEAGYLEHRLDVAFVVYKHYDPGFQSKDVRQAMAEGSTIPVPKPAREVVQPLSGQIIRALDEYVDSLPSFKEKFSGWRSSDPIQSPFLFWYCYRSPGALEGMEEPHRKQMLLLTEWIDSNYSEMYAEVETKFPEGHVSKTIMPFFIQPGEVLVSKNEKGIQGYIAESWPVKFDSITSPPDYRNGPPKVTQTWAVKAWSYGYDGKFYRNSTTLYINLKFDEDNPDVSIAKLNILPIRFGNSEFRTKLDRRGRTMWACRKRNLVAYKDTTEDDLSGEGERYMIDFNTYKQLHSDSRKFKIAYSSLTSPYRKEMDAAVMECDDPPYGAELLVFPNTIVGYNLRQKKWQDLQIDLMQKVIWNKQAFRHLVIDQEIKDIIQALVTSRLETDQTTDLIQGKGNGLIILLHGGPGTGKTFTAESVAELAEKPLFRVTCGDIGTKPEAVEKYLESVLHLGKIWGCVVLLDEADVFLEQRTLTDLERNALVSVFLRVLEYYEGILILTSNRVGTFDEAFKSRIQLSLHYESLTKDQRRTIWENFLNRLNNLEQENLKIEPIEERKRKFEENKGINLDDIQRHLADLAEEQMNGRQIRNAITTARQLAKFKGERMTYRHLKHVISISKKFDKYLEKTRHPDLLPLCQSKICGVNQELHSLSKKVLLKIGYTDILLQTTINERCGGSRDMEDEYLKDIITKFSAFVRREKLAIVKIKCAAGKRPDEAGQKAIMGDVSATAIGRVFGWSSKRLKSDVFPVEENAELQVPEQGSVGTNPPSQWLHPWFFSWVGIADESDPKAFSTSQGIESLVFGVSGTNSLVTGYETAWQRFFLAETDIIGTEKDITVELKMHCNDFSKPILWETEISHGKLGILMLQFS